MTISTPKVAGLCAVAGALALLSQPAQAAIVYNDGELILGFRATGGQGASTDYLVDLGSAASVLANTSSATQLNLGISADLVALYGSSWFSRADVLWSISGVQKIAGNGFGNNTMFATRSDSLDAPLGTNSTTPWPRPSSFGAGTPAGKIQAMGQKYGAGTTGAVIGTDQIESTNRPGALLQPIAQTSSYASFQPNGVNTTGASAFSYFVDANGIEGNFGSSSSSVLDLYRIDTGSGPAAFAGSLVISPSAQITFTPVGVPEPTVALSLFLGVTALGTMRRRSQTR